MNKKFMSGEEIYEDLCYKIENLEYMPGQMVSENELCGVYDVSRHIVRSAITRLSERKLMSVYPQRGTLISLIDMKYVEEILYIREAIEHEAIHRLRDLYGKEYDKMIEKMEDNIAEQEHAIEMSVGMQEFYKIDNRFHKCFMDAVGHGDSMQFISYSYIHVRRWRNFEVRSMKRLKELVKDHRNIKDALQERNFEKTNNILHNHLNTVERLQDIFRNNSPEYFIFK